MFRKSVVSIVLVALVLTLTVPLAQGVGFQEKCEEDYGDREECEVDYRAEVIVTRDFHFGEFTKDFALGFFLGPFSLIPSFCCGEREVSGCEWKNPEYKEKEKYRDTCRTKERNSEVLNKLMGWGASILTIFAIENACC